MTPATLLRAAEILEREAESIKCDNSVPGYGWTDDSAQRDYNELIAVAAELRKGALLQPVA